MLTLMYITNSPEIALIAEANGVQRVWVDLETLGKEERQKGRNTVKSNHSVEDVRAIKPLLTKAQMLVRINPWHEDSQAEVDAVIGAGADIIMLPMWKTADEVKCFLKAVRGRINTTLLLETREAEACLDEVLALEGIDEIHIGLNDLHISYGLDFMFELLANGTVENICQKIAARGIPYGFGGIAKIGDGAVPAEKIILEHYRLGSSRAILSRTFCDNAKITSTEEIERVFRLNMKALRAFDEYAVQAPEEAYERNRQELCEAVERVAQEMRAKRG